MPAWIFFSALFFDQSYVVNIIISRTWHGSLGLFLNNNKIIFDLCLTTTIIIIENKPTNHRNIVFVNKSIISNTYENFLINLSLFYFFVEIQNIKNWAIDFKSVIFKPMRRTDCLLINVNMILIPKYIPIELNSYCSNRFEKNRIEMNNIF